MTSPTISFLHLGLESFAIAANMLRTGPSLSRFALFTVGFSCMTPLGIAIGMIVEAAAHDTMASR